MLLLACLLLPLAGAAVIRATAAGIKPHGAAVVAILTVGIAHLLSWVAFARLLGEPPAARIHDVFYFTLLDVGDLNVGFLLRWDPLSQLMLMMVTGVAFLIHVYSAAYLEGDDRYPYFFADLNLFVFSMLLLVLGGNYVLLFSGWELVGLSSYLLIGFWSAKPSAADAGRKAFVVNRIGDFGFVLGIVLLAAVTGALDFTTVFAKAPAALPAGSGIALAAALCLFCGAVGKSAQFPLHVWLPDAMEGPTPVSALIHAATMVTAGVYMVCRSHPLFELAPLSLSVVAWTGAVTSLLAGTIALAQNDLKRILAYSTVSQLGLMFLAAGAGAYAPAMFHLFTHAFFKALLFLAAGSVMHAMAGELDVWKMGGLRRALPWTFGTFLVGALALTGAPLTAGFFSKDELLWSAFASGGADGRWLWAAGLAASLLTGVYTFRALWLTFLGEARYDRHAVHPHESPPLMVWPLVALAAGAILTGYLWVPPLLGGHGSPFETFLDPVLGAEQEAAAGAAGQGMAMTVAIGVFLAGLLIGWGGWRRAGGAAKRIASSARFLYVLFRDKWYVDEAYEAAIIRPLYAALRWLEGAVDRGTVDAGANAVADGAARAASLGSLWESGYIRHYALAFALGAGLLAVLPVLASVFGG